MKDPRSSTFNTFLCMLVSWSLMKEACLSYVLGSHTFVKLACDTRRKEKEMSGFPLADPLISAGM